MNGPNDHQKRDGVGWEEQEALDRMAALSTQGSFHRGVRVLRLMGNTPVIAGLGASEVGTACFCFVCVYILRLLEVCKSPYHRFSVMGSGRNENYQLEMR
jgi:hypothetical protein